MSRKQSRVLIIDDEPSVLVGLQLAFEDVDWHIEVATSGATALERIGDGFDLIITDKNLPDIDGVELVRRIRIDDPEVRVVMITGYASLDSAVETANLGIDAYIEKPFRDVFEVRKQVEALLAKKSVSHRIAQFLAKRRAEKRQEESGPLELPTEPPPISEDSFEKGQVLIACADTRAQKHLSNAVDPKLSHHLVTSTRELLHLAAKAEPLAIVVSGALDIVDLCSRIRKANEDCALVVVSELDLPSAKALIEIGITALINHPPESEPCHRRLKKVVRAAYKSRQRSS